MKMELTKRNNSGRSGAFSVLVSHHILFILPNTDVPLLMNIYMVFCALQGDPQADGQNNRPKRSVQKMSATK